VSPPRYRHEQEANRIHQRRNQTRQRSDPTYPPHRRFEQREKYQYSDAELDTIFATLHAEVALATLRFKQLDFRNEKDFQLSRIDTITRQRSRKPQAPWIHTFDSLTNRRGDANQRLRKIRSKPFAADKNADYLLQHLSKALHLPVKPANLSPVSWALENPASVVVLDAKRAAQTFKPTLENAPQSMIKGRLKAIRSFAREVRAIEAIRPPRGSRLPRGVDRRYTIVLFRQATTNNAR
jgi:hypothetical protein